MNPATPTTPDDPAYGHTLSTLSEIGAPTPPDDFEEFWRDLHARARTIATHAKVSAQAASADPRFVVHDIEFASLGGVRLGGWLSLPANGKVERGLVVGHGYGGREGPDPYMLADDAAALFFCARGLPTRGLHTTIPADSYQHVLHGISARETYVLGGCVADTWCAVSALTELVPEAASSIGYVGASFGGGTGALALPWDDRITAALLVLPTFGNHALRMTLPCTGSGEAVRWYSQGKPEVIEVLRYFDAATAATFVQIPTHVGLALADPAVPPPGQFAIYNALAGPKEYFLLTAGHLEYPDMLEEGAGLLASQRSFLRCH